MALPQPTVTIRSAAFRDHYLRMDGSTVKAFSPSGGGIVNTQIYNGPYEIFTLVRNPDGTVAFQSTAFNNTFLRMDASNVPAGTEILGGGGTVNVQFTQGPAEKFRIHMIGNPNAGPTNPTRGTVAIESAEWPGRWLCFSDGPNPGDVTVKVQGKLIHDCAVDLLMLS